VISLDEDAVVAAVDLVGRSGARSCEVGWDCPHTPDEEDGHTCPDITWQAHAQYRGARITEQGHRGPVEAAEALARRLLTGATCRCGRLATMTDAGGVAFDRPRSVIQQQLRDLGLEMVSAKRAAKAGFCRWTRNGKRWEPSCDAPPIRVRGRR
jgi:hypothetical protein